MSRFVLLVAMLGLAQSRQMTDCAGDGNDWCYCYLDGGNDWCWATTDGKTTYAKEGTDGYSCADYNGYTDANYCEHKDGHEDTSSASSQTAAEPAADTASASADSGGSGDCKTSWSCPASWTTGGSAPSDAPDAKAFIAAHNIYRCMHNVQAVQWDKDVYDGAKSWAVVTGETMSHSHGGSQYRKDSDGENLAGTFKESAHRGVDATHMWYSEIRESSYCNWQKSCFQSFSAGHFTAMIWSTINKIAYSDTTKKLAVGRYRGCDGKPPNFNGAYVQHVPAPVKNWGECATTVLACPAFSGLTEDDVEGCEGSTAWDSSHGDDWYMVYKNKCSDLYANAVSKVYRRYNIPEVLQPLMSNPWPVAVACGSSFVIFLGMAVRRSWRRKEAASQDSELLSDEGLE